MNVYRGIRMGRSEPSQTELAVADMSSNLVDSKRLA
jgi:hypothetical protein